ncbi:MAG TPA: AraC family transcriptional regulator [Firmicutes bacterium]|nr:AraC family transcriptional regulator [Bacillota bacterium]
MTDRNFDYSNYFQFNYNFDRGENQINLDFHSHRLYEIFLVLEGECRYHVESDKYCLSKGDLLLIDSMEKHKFEEIENTSCYRLTLFFTPKYIAHFTSAYTDLLSCFKNRSEEKWRILHLTERELKDFMHIVNQSIEKFHSSVFGDDVISLTHFIKALIYINRLYYNVSSPTIIYSEKCKKIKDYIDTHLLEELTIQKISKAVNIPVSTVCKIFKRETNNSIYSYITGMRVLHARSLMTEGRSATESCYLSGFKNYSNFYKRFKSVLGVSPKEYRSASF